MRNEKVSILNKNIGSNEPPFLIAEMSGNHNQSLERALEIVKAAADAGAHALKIQTYTADTMTLNLRESEFSISNSSSLWNQKSLYDLYVEAYTPWEWHKPIFDYAQSLGLIAFSTPFDKSSVDFLESLSVPCYKIASFENTDLPLIRYTASTGKPLIISTGMASISEIDELVSTCYSAGCKDVILLKCTSAYPAYPEDINLLTIPNLRETFGCSVGISDHTMGIGVAVAAVALGASVIEKHFTLDRSDGGVDSAFSMQPDEFEQLCREAKSAWLALGKVSYGPTISESQSVEHKRSLYIVKNLKRGDILDTTNIRSIRPGKGLAPKHIETVLGRKVSRDIMMGTPLTWSIIE
jgi:N-acetylneuraminate synthase